MKNTMERKKSLIKDPYLFPLETEPTEIIEAMNLIVEHSESTGFTENMFFYLQKPIHYLCDRLHLTERQAVLLSVVCELGTEYAVSTNNLGSFFGCSNLNAVAFIKDLDELVTRRLLAYDKTYAKAYCVVWDMLTAYSCNKEYEPQVHYDTCEELLLAIEALSQEYDSNFSYSEFHNQIQYMLNDNPHLAFSRALLKHKFPRNDQAMLINACLMLCCHDQHSFEYDDFTRFVDRRHLISSRRELMGGTHNLITGGWISPCCDDGLEDRDTFELTQKAKDELLSEVVLKPADSQLKQFRDLILPQSINEKPLHYNPSENAQVRRLRGLLEQQEFIEVRDRLVNSGMRTGFACLFYGAPGTGKTETVMQLARATGRGIFQVNMANIRSKWVGESEKNVKSLFSQYHAMVSRAEVTPILLLNEADALLGNRFTNVSRSVERMENTM